MIDLRDYFLNNLSNDSPYNKFKDVIENGIEDYTGKIIIPNLVMYDTKMVDEDLIDEFKKQCSLITLVAMMAVHLY